jgi:hypothetical protein
MCYNVVVNGLDSKDGLGLRLVAIGLILVPSTSCSLVKIAVSYRLKP